MLKNIFFIFFKKQFSFYLNILLIFFVFLQYILIQNVNAQSDDNFQIYKQEKIQQFIAEINILPNSDVAITEKITYDFGNNQKHGIYRFIPIKYKDKKGVRSSIKIKNIKVTLDQKQVPYKISKNNKNITIKIGDKNKLISGKHTYQISYLVSRVINFFPEQDEFYWNVTGDKWNVDIQKTKVNIKAPKIKKVKSFVGIYGSKQECQLTNQTSQQAEFDCPKMKAGEGVTIAIAVNKGILKEPSISQKIGYFLADNYIIFLPIVVFILMFIQWWKKGRDPKGRGVIVPYYDVPDDLSVGEVSFLINEKLPNNDLSAMIIQLAIKGYLKIKQTQKGKLFRKSKYVFYKLDSNKQQKPLTSEEKILLDKLFSLGSNNQVSSGQLAYNFYKYIPEIKKEIVKSVLKKQYFSEDPTKVFKFWFKISGLIAFISYFAIMFFGFLTFYSLLVSSIIVFLFAFFMPKYTQKGIETKEKLDGFKLYLKTAEKDRIKFHNAPEKNPEIFEKFLPYAMVFGVEKEWAQQFEDIYNQATDWYEGVGNKAFSSVALVNNLNSFSSMANSTLSVSPSSASSGGSGFSGGGSGGGFGGGGGGSW